MDDDQSDNEHTVSRQVVGQGLLRHRPFRRNLLFGTTLATLVIVFVGAVPLGPTLMKRPFWFTMFWSACFLLVGFVLILAFYDLIRIRKEHRRRMRELEKELASAAEEARRIARETAED